MAEEIDFFADEQPVKIPPFPEADKLTPEQRADPNTITALREPEEDFFADEQPVTSATQDALLDQNQSLIDSIVSSLAKKGTERFFGEDVQDPFLIPRSIGIIAGSAGLPILANQYMPPTTPPPARALVTFGTSLFGTTLGAVSPELALQIAEDLSLIEPGTRKRLALSAIDMNTLVQGELVIDAAFGTGFVVLRKLGVITGRFFTTGGVLTEKGREALGLANDASGKFGIQMMPVQIRGRTISTGFLTILGNFPFTTNVVKARAKLVDAQAEKALRELGPRIGPLARFSELSPEILLKATKFFKAVGRKFDIRYTRIYERAREIGVMVTPSGTTQHTRKILETIDAANQTFATGAQKATGDAGAVTGRFVKFLRENFIPLETTTLIKGEKVNLTILQESGEPFVKLLPDIPPNIARQNLEQMNGLISKIDEFMSTLDKTSNQDQFVRSMATQLKLAIMNDIMTNVTGKNLGDAQDIVRALKKANEDYSLTMSSVFETATANRIGAVKKGGLKGRGVLTDATRQPVDTLAKTIIQLDSPQAVGDLRTLVGAKTFKRIVAQVMNDAVEKAMKTAEGSGGALKQFNTQAFIDALGIKKGFGNRRAAITEMLNIADSPFKMKDLDTLVKILEKIEGVPIPDVATFVARRAILSGWKGALGSFMGSAGAVTALTGNFTTLLAAATIFIGGSKFFSRLISKPETAKSFMKAMDETASTAVRRTAYIRAMRLGIQSMQQEEPNSANAELMIQFRELMQELDEVMGFEGKDLDRLLREGVENFKIDLNKQNGGVPELDIREELSSFGGDVTLQ